jgi:glycosyltransferase involved in cell wall biosynthesis
LVDYFIIEKALKVPSISVGKFEPRVSIIIPAFNEEARIDGVLRKWIDFLDYFCPNEYEILVIVDGCTDNTADIVSKFANGRIVPLIYLKRLGKGGALMEGFKWSRGDVIFFTDADGSLNVNDFVNFMDAIEFCDLVVGCRYFRGSSFVAGLPLRRLLFSRTFNCLVKLLFPKLRGFHDTQCGAKAVRRNVIRKVGRDLFITDFAFDINLIYSALRFGFIVKEVAVGYNHVEKDSKVSRSLFKTGFGMFLSVVRLRIYYSKFRKLVFGDGFLRHLIGFLVKVVP